LVFNVDFLGLSLNFAMFTSPLKSVMIIRPFSQFENLIFVKFYCIFQEVQQT